MTDKKELQKIYTMFHLCAPLFIALGDEVRQQLVLDIVDAGEGGINVSNLAAKSHLSRPAISHHLKVLKNCGLVKPVKDGTQIFYHIDLKENLDNVSDLVSAIQNVLEKMNNSGTKNTRSGHP